MKIPRFYSPNLADLIPSVVFRTVREGAFGTIKNANRRTGLGEALIGQVENPYALSHLLPRQLSQTAFAYHLGVIFHRVRGNALEPILLRQLNLLGSVNMRDLAAWEPGRLDRWEEGPVMEQAQVLVTPATAQRYPDWSYLRLHTLRELLPQADGEELIAELVSLKN